MTRAKYSKFMAATALVVAGSMLGCAAQVPAGPDAKGAIGPAAVAPAPDAVAPSDAARLPAMVGDGAGSMTSQSGDPAPTVAIPERGEPVIPADTMKYRAPIHSLEDVLKQSGLGPVPESQAPTPEMIKKILPQKLSQAQASSLLVKIPADMVQAGALEDLAGETDGAAVGGSISASSSRGRTAGGASSKYGRGDDQYDRTDKHGRGGNSYGRGGNSHGRGGNSHGRGDSSYGRGDSSYGRGDRGGHGQVGGSHGNKGRAHDRTYWSNWGYSDPDLFLASSFGWNDFIYGGSYFFFPATVFGALHFFPYTYASGFFYPAYCPFYFSAAMFIPYCQAPLVWFGTFGLVSGCPTCPISGRPLLWFPGEVPVI